eukprot:m.57148 g.57148  ORF g.57148 m.57148 type:complete len:256 (-) comp11083_c1_seq1:157-924(-)
MESLPLPTIKGLSTRTVEEKKEAAEAKAHKAAHEELRRLRGNKSENNNECADCTAKRPGWASLPHGVFICINCSQIHRGIGRHISQVKSFSSGTYTWYPDEIAAMREMGNTRANELYLSPQMNPPNKPSEDAPQHIRERYIRDKYEKQLWVAKENSKTRHSPKSSPRLQLKRAQRERKAKRELSSFKPFNDTTHLTDSTHIDNKSTSNLLDSSNTGKCAAPCLAPQTTSSCSSQLKKEKIQTQNDPTDFFANWGL